MATNLTKEVHNGIMIALPMPQAAEVMKSVDFSEGSDLLPEDELHVTMMYLGDEPITKENSEALKIICSEIAKSTPPIQGKINGVGFFSETHKEGKECMWAAFDSAAIPALRQKIVDMIGQSKITSTESTHGFTPHITMAYYPKGKQPKSYAMPSVDVTVPALRLAIGGEVTDFPFGGEAKKEEGFYIIKQSTGAYRWVLISSSAFRDRDGEIITRKALEEDVKRCDINGEYGPLRWWHLGTWEAPDGLENWETWRAGKGLDIGTCDFNMVHGKLLIESGLFKTAELGEAFSRVPPDQLEASISFSHPVDEPDSEKVYNNIHRFERSLLPAGMASNMLTKLFVSKGASEMELRSKVDALVAILKGRPDVAKSILEDATAIEKAAEASGLASKEVRALLEGTVEAPAAGETPATETPAETPEPEKKDPPQEEPPAQDKAKEDEEDEEEQTMWTASELKAFVTKVFSELIKENAAGSVKKEVELDSRITEAMSALGAQADRLAVIEKSVKEVSGTVTELSDARPAGIRQLQERRQSASEDNVTNKEITGPTMDDSFLAFAKGAK